MPKFNLEKSILIEAPAEKVFDVLADFHQWRAWSPWLILEPEARVDVAADGKSYSWKGIRIGEGEMSKERVDRPRELRFDLLFLKPWKSRSKTGFLMEEQAGKTKVIWTMEGSLPFFLFFMKKMMINLIGMDYNRGLNMLKDYVETGSVPSILEKIGKTSWEGCSYVGITTVCTLEEVGPKMQGDFRRLGAWRDENRDSVSGVPFSIYHKWDLNKGQVRYTSGFPVNKTPAQLPDGFVTGELSGTETYCISHTGPYRHLGNAWSLGMNLCRGKIINQKKQLPPFETYPTDPLKVDEKECVTKIHFPMK